MTTGTAIAAPRAGAMRRVLEVVGVVALWIALGIAFHLGANAYLLLGIALTAGFQWGVRRQPMRALWARDAPPFRLGMTGWGLSCILAAYPCYCFITNLRTKVY